MSPTGATGRSCRSGDPHSPGVGENCALRVSSPGAAVGSFKRPSPAFSRRTMGRRWIRPWPEEHVAAVVERNRHDLELYRRAQPLLQRQVESEGPAIQEQLYVPRHFSNVLSRAGTALETRPPAQILADEVATLIETRNPSLARASTHLLASSLGGEFVEFDRRLRTAT